jgi:hypothetical protein
MNLFLRIPLSLAAAAVLGIGCGDSTDDTPPPALTDEEMVSADINNLGGDAAVQWWQVRELMKKYKDVSVAEKDGYIPASPCEALPDVGAMGVHYLHPGTASDLVLDPSKPEVLLYVPTEDGLQLTGVEYFVADTGQARPSIVGQSFDGPMPGHNPQMPVHYDLHVWLFKHNNSGLFAQWNPRVKCPAE